MVAESRSVQLDLKLSRRQRRDGLNYHCVGDCAEPAHKKVECDCRTIGYKDMCVYVCMSLSLCLTSVEMKNLSMADKVRMPVEPALFLVQMPSLRRTAACALIPAICVLDFVLRDVANGTYTAWVGGQAEVKRPMVSGVATWAQSSELAAQTRYVPGRRLAGKRRDSRRPYVPEANNRRKIAWLLILSGLAGYQAPAFVERC